MENVNLILYVAIAVPLFTVLLFGEIKSRMVVIFLLIGMTVGLFCGEVNTLVFNAIPLPEELFVVNISPVIEELCKALPIIAYAFLYCPSRKNLLISSFALGVGFAILENAIIIFSVEKISLWFALIRGFGCGISHGLCTMAVGYGCSFIYKRRKLFYTGTFALLLLAIILHAIYNLLMIGNYVVIGSVSPIVLLIVFRLLTRGKSNKKLGNSL